MIGEMQLGRLRHWGQVILLISGLSFEMTVEGQVSEDNLDQVLVKTNKIDHDSIYYEMFKTYRKSDLDKAKHYATIAYRLADNNQHYFRRVRSCIALAYVYDQNNQVDSALNYYLEGIRISTRHRFKERLMYLYNDIGSLYERMDLYDSALRNYNLSYSIASQLGSAYDQAIAKNNIALVFYHLENYEEALINIKEAVDIKNKNGIKQGIPLNLMNIAFIYNDQGQYQEALDVLGQVEKECVEGCPDNIMSDLNYAIGYSKYKQGKNKEAYPYFVNAMKLLKKMGSREQTYAHTLQYLASYKAANGDYEHAIEELMEAEAIAKQISNRRIRRDIYAQLSQIYDKTGELDLVVKYQQQYITMKDSIFNEKLANNLKNIQLDVQRRQSREIILQKDEQIQRSKLILFLVVIVSVLVVIVALLLYRTSRINRRMKITLEWEVKNRTADLLKSNKELKRSYKEYDHLVYRTSHDIRGPLATLIGLTNIARQDNYDAERVKDYLNKIESTANGLSSTLSQLTEINTLRNQPICLEQLDLNKTIEQAFNSFNKLNHFPLFSLQIEKGDWSLGLETDKQLLYYILTKLFDNSFNYFSPHTERKYIKVGWSQDKNWTTISVEDNGQGIDPSAKDKVFQLFYVANEIHGQGIGLFLAQLAANRIGGRIILARSSKPTVFKLVIPNKPADGTTMFIQKDDQGFLHESG